MDIEESTPDFESSIRVKVNLGVAIAGLLLVTPFSANHIVQGRYILGLGSLIVILILAVNAWGALRGRYFPLLLLLTLIPAIILFLAYAISKQGVIGALWCYPALISFYFMLPERQAWVANILLLAVMLPLTWLKIDPALAARVTVTILCVSVFAAIFVRVISLQQRKLSELAMRDSLTGLFNRVLLQSSLEQAIQLHQRSAVPMTLIALDLDHFKAINDRQGHDAGDEVLKGVASLLLKRVRGSDKVFRLGGEEFLVLLYDTGLEEGRQVAEVLRKAIEAAPLLAAHTVTTSAGVALCQSGDNWRDWVKRSDDRLYQAKAEGRNRVVA